jgi:hypothetical protein
VAGRVCQTAFFVVVALIIQYYYLQGSVKAMAGLFKPYQYNCGAYEISTEFPSSADLHLTPDIGENMLLNIYFTDNKLKYRGYIQLWLLDDVERFLKDSKAKSTYDFISFSRMKVELHNYTGYQEEWTADFGGTFISAKEYWLEIKKSGEAVRISFFSDTAEFSEQQNKIMNHVINSLHLTTNE